MKKKIIGYTDGTFDLFHYGHVEFLKHAKKNCDYLIVGINDDSIVDYKDKPILNAEERIKAINGCKYVDYAFINYSRDKLVKYNEFKFDVLFVGSDWKGTDRWNKFEECLQKYNVKVIYIDYTKSISSTMIKRRIYENQ